MLALFGILLFIVTPSLAWPALAIAGADRVGGQLPLLAAAGLIQDKQVGARFSAFFLQEQHGHPVTLQDVVGPLAFRQKPGHIGPMPAIAPQRFARSGSRHPAKVQNEGQNEPLPISQRFGAWIPLFQKHLDASRFFEENHGRDSFLS